MFILLPVAVDYQARRYPVVTFTLMGINTALYLLGLVLFFGGDREAEPLVMNLGLVPDEKTSWTWLTSMFVHEGFFHLAGNMIYLFLFGACVEDLLGRLRFSLFYLGGGLLANLSQVLLTTDLDAHIPIVGASGAICACIGAFLIALPGTEINFRYFGWIFFRVFSGEFWLKAWLVIAFWFLMDFASLVLQLGFAGGGGGVAFGAHVGGTLAGALVMWLLNRTVRHAEKTAILPGTARPPLRSASRAEAPPLDEPAAIYLYVNEQQIGPFARSRIQEMLELGSITPETQYWQEGMPEWRPVAEL
jgi:membrane associated rhomboid family serine protease